MVIDFITQYSCHMYFYFIFYIFQLPDTCIVDLEIGVLSVMVNDTFL